MEEKKMEKIPEQQYPYYYDEDEIDLAELFQVLYKRRKFIISGVISLTILSIIICFILPKSYRAEGIFRLDPDSVSPAIYRECYALYSNIERFKNYYQKYVKDKELKEIFDNISKDTISFKKTVDEFIEPLESNPKKREKLPSNIFGLRIKPEAKSPILAHKYALFLGNYIRNTIMYKILSDDFSNNYYNSTKNFRDIDNKIIKLNVDINTLIEKKELLSKIMQSYPISKKFDVTQIISVEKGGYKYLPPVLQIVGIKSNLADLKTNLTVLQRQRKLISLYYNFYKKLYDKKDDIKDGNELFKIFEKEYNLLSKNNKDDVYKEFYNTLTIQLNNYKQTFFEKIKFVAGPFVPSKPIKPKKKLIVAVTFVSSLFLFIFLAFFVEWWENNNQKVKE